VLRVAARKGNEMNRELDVELAKLTGWREIWGPTPIERDWFGISPDPSIAEAVLIPRFTESLDAHVPVWREIERRGLWMEYVYFLDVKPDHCYASPPANYAMQVLLATPEQHTRAEIAVLKGAK